VYRPIGSSAIPLLSMLLFCIAVEGQSVSEHAPNTALVNGKWFNGSGFEPRTMYSVDGTLTTQRPPWVVQTLDLAGTWIVPPLGEAHNHNIGTGVEERDRRALEKYLADGVFYVKVTGNLPLSLEEMRRLGINQPRYVDASIAQGSLTASGGWPALLVERILPPQGYYPRHTPESLRDHRYFAIDSEADLDSKWDRILELRPDFIKTFLWFSEEYEKRRADPQLRPFSGLDPRLLGKIVEKARASNLRVSTHVTTAADFRHAVVAGVDEVAHLPMLGKAPIDESDARTAAKKGTVVVTTASLLHRLRPMILPEAELPQVRQTQIENLKRLRAAGVKLAIGSDNVNDSSWSEVLYLQDTGIFDNLSLLKMWTEDTAAAIFPDRKIGRLENGHEASFLAVAGDPIQDLQNLRKIRIRFKQGHLLP
jgi:hypothetical protein